MLNVLSEKKKRLEIENIEVIEAAWDTDGGRPMDEEVDEGSVAQAAINTIKQKG